MNKIVRDHYPVENLPQDLRQGLGKTSTVRVVIEVEEPSSETLPGFANLDPTLSSSVNKTNTLVAMARYRMENSADVTTQEAVERIRRLRDEWDD